MRKAIFLILFVLLIPSGVLAQEKTLNDISEDMLFLIETYTDCVSHESVCTEDDARDLKAGAGNSLHDLVVLVRSGNAGQMILTVRQAQLLNEKIHIVRERLVMLTAFDAGCNLAIFCIKQALWSLLDGIKSAVYIAAVISSLLGTWTNCGLCILLVFAPVFMALVSFYFFMGGVFFLAALFLSPACLFWWL
jgi:hypothetical protein